MKHAGQWVLGTVLAAAVLFVLITGVGTHSLYPLMQPFPLAGHQRLLVLAPHADDETLGPGGLILAARNRGMQVRVVVETNGDGTIFATMEDFHRLFPSASDYIRMGNIRQKETLAAMQVLGIPASDVTFLSYPDRGTPALWSSHWDTRFTSPYTRDDHSPYAITFNPNAHYTGTDLLGDLQKIITDYQPDLIVYPHPEDVHPDHWGLSVFSHLAIALARRDIPGYRPDTFVYLVHRPDFPMPKGYYPQDDLQPPLPLMNIDRQWYRLDLSPEAEAVKTRAIGEYRSQLPSLRELLDSFVRINELFGTDEEGTLPGLGQAQANDPSTWRDGNGFAVAPVQRDPVQDYPIRDLLPSSDIVALYAGWWQDSLLECVQIRAQAAEDLTYHLHLKAIGPEGVTDVQASSQPRPGQLPAHVNGRYICAQITAVELKRPEYIYLGASISSPISERMDQIAWKLLEVNLNDLAQ